MDVAIITAVIGLTITAYVLGYTAGLNSGITASPNGPTDGKFWLTVAGANLLYSIGVVVLELRQHRGSIVEVVSGD